VVALIEKQKLFNELIQLGWSTSVSISDLLYSNQVWCLLSNLVANCRETRASDEELNQLSSQRETYKPGHRLLSHLPVAIKVPNVVGHELQSLGCNLPCVLAAKVKKRI